MVISPEWSSLKRIEAVQTEWPRKVYVKRWKCSNCVQSSEPLNAKVYLFGWILEVPDRVHHELAHLSHFTHSFAFFRSSYIELEIIESLGKLFELVENTWNQQKPFITSIKLIDSCYLSIFLIFHCDQLEFNRRLQTEIKILHDKGKTF